MLLLRPIYRLQGQKGIQRIISSPIVSQQLRCYSDKSSFEHSAKALVGLKNGELQNQQEADEEAKAWIDALKEIRSDFEAKKSGDGKYSPGKAFAPPGVSEIDIIQQVVDEKASEKFQPTQEQKDEITRLKSMPVPPKNDETMNYLTNLIMKDGKKARAEKLMGQALYLVHLQLRQDPVKIVKNILADMAPLLKLKRYTDGGARAELVPTPLNERQRIRQAWLWILESANRRGSKDFSVRLAQEILAAHKGNSPGYEKRNQQHKLAVTKRAFIKLLTKK